MSNGSETQDRFLEVIGGLRKERQDELEVVAGRSATLESADAEAALESIANRSISGSFEGGEAALLGKPERSALAFLALFGALGLVIWAFVEVTKSEADGGELCFMGFAVTVFLAFSFLNVSGFKKVKMSISSGTNDEPDEDTGSDPDEDSK